MAGTIYGLPSDGSVPERGRESYKALSRAEAVQSAFPSPAPPSNAAFVADLTVSGDTNGGSHGRLDGERYEFAVMPEAEALAWFGGGGRHIVSDWFGNPVIKPGTGLNDLGTPRWVFRCVTNSPWLALRGLPVGATGEFQIRVNGVLVSPRPMSITDPQAAAMSVIDLTFRDSQWRTVEIFTHFWHSTLNWDSAYTCEPWTPEAQKSLYVIGDSWVAGTDQAGPVTAWPYALQARAPWDVSVNGQGGTGYVAGSANAWNAPYTAQHRIDAITAAAPDLLLAWGSINDGLAGKTNAEIEAAATSFYSSVAAGSPDTKILVVGPQMHHTPEQPGNTEAIRAAAEAAPNVIGFVDPIAEGWAGVEGLVGPTDGIHPSILGAEYLADRIAAVVRRETVKAGDNTW